VTFILQDENKDCSTKAVNCIHEACRKYSKPDDIQSMVNAGCVSNVVGVLKKPNSIHTKNLKESVHYIALKVVQIILGSECESDCNMLAVQECGGIGAIAKLQVICSLYDSGCFAIRNVTSCSGQ
jgi:hypothetical protein